MLARAHIRVHTCPLAFPPAHARVQTQLRVAAEQRGGHSRRTAVWAGDSCEAEEYCAVWLQEWPEGAC